MSVRLKDMAESAQKDFMLDVAKATESTFESNDVEQAAYLLVVFDEDAINYMSNVGSKSALVSCAAEALRILGEDEGITRDYDEKPRGA